ncbi:MAG TPA: hypothetical protein VGM53_18475 [Streptosporangiaceae bacterium]
MLTQLEVGAVRQGGAGTEQLAQRKKLAEQLVIKESSPMVEVRLHVRGKYPVSDLAAELSEVDGVASVLVGNDQAADD